MTYRPALELDARTQGGDDVDYDGEWMGCGGVLQSKDGVKELMLHDRKEMTSSLKPQGPLDAYQFGLSPTRTQADPAEKKRKKK